MMPACMASVGAGAGMIMWAMVASNLLWGVVMAYIFVQWANISTWQSRVTPGTILGLFISAAYDFGFFAMTTLFTLQDVAIYVALNTFL